MVAGLAVAWFLLAHGIVVRDANRAKRTAHIHDVLVYCLDERHDPAEFIGALLGAGYRSSLVEPDERLFLRIECPDGRRQDRSDVRSVLEQAQARVDHAWPGDRTVRFADEDPA